MDRRKLLQSIAGIGAIAGTGTALSKDKSNSSDWMPLPPITELNGELVTFWQGDDHGRACVIFYASWIHGYERYAVGTAVTRECLQEGSDAKRLARKKILGAIENTISLRKDGVALSGFRVASLVPEGGSIPLI